MALKDLKRLAQELGFKPQAPKLKEIKKLGKNYKWTEANVDLAIAIFNREQSLDNAAWAIGIGTQALFAMFKNKGVEVVKIARRKPSRP